MISVIDFCVKCCSKLLRWMNKCLYFQIRHFKNFWQCLSFSFKHGIRSFNHVSWSFILYNFNFTLGLIKLFQNRRILIWFHSNLYILRWILCFLSRIFSFCSLRPIFLDSINMMVYFPKHFFVIFIKNFIIFINLDWYHLLTLKNYINSPLLPSSYLNFQEVFFVL